MPSFGGPPGFGGPGGAVTQKLAELRTALADPNTTSEQLKEKIGAVRSAREKAKAELAAARQDLLELLTPDQEAMLVSLDCLD
jgi:outer membrane murein-binding lipoprotein Lpp